jgi:hypothetical protein
MLVTEILQLEQFLKVDEGASAFKLRQRYIDSGFRLLRRRLILRREGNILIAVLKSGLLKGVGGLLG